MMTTFDAMTTMTTFVDDDDIATTINDDDKEEARRFRIRCEVEIEKGKISHLAVFF